MKNAQSQVKSADIHYIKGDLFTTFVSAGRVGDTLMSEFMQQNNNSNKVLTIHADSVIAQIRAKGYIVRKAPKMDKIDIGAIFQELDALGI